MLSETLEIKVPGKIDLTGLKAFARKELPLDSTLREMILGERDQIQAEEFLVKMEVWVKLFNMEMKITRSLGD